MADNMNCPACGAAIDFSAGRDQARCDYCGSAFRFVEEDGESRLQLLYQPELRADSLLDGTQQQVIGAQENKPDYEPLEPENTAPDAQLPGPGMPPYPSMTSHMPERMGGQPVGEGGSGTSRRWIAGIVAAVVVLCVLCACIVGAVVIAGNLLAV